MPTYLYTASQCPLPQTPLTPLYASASPPTPVVGTGVTSGTSAGAQSLPTIIDSAQVRGNLLGRYGGGAYAVWQGLELSDGGGLTLNISAGQAGLDGPAEIKVATTLPLTDNVLNRTWISRGGTPNAVTSVSANPLLAPDTAKPWAFLGTVPVAGSIRDIDYSGRFTQYQGNLLWRRTADADEPDDAALLPSSVRFLTRTVGGLWLWDGLEYTKLDGATTELSDALTTSTADLADLQRQFRLQLQWTAQMWGQEFVHPELYPEIDLAS